MWRRWVLIKNISANGTRFLWCTKEIGKANKARDHSRPRSNKGEKRRVKNRKVVYVENDQGNSQSKYPLRKYM